MGNDEGTTTIYRLLRPGYMQAEPEPLPTDEQMRQQDLVCVHPEYLAICAADQRYWSGKRDPEALAEKLPMALIHEAVGTVREDVSGRFADGERVVLVPNWMPEATSDVGCAGTVADPKENYSLDAVFCSSDGDGFLRETVAIPRAYLLDCADVDPLVAVLSELVSVCCNALTSFAATQAAHPEVLQQERTVGIWGDGAVGYLLAATLKERYPNFKLLLFGAHEAKMELFDFVDERYNVRNEFADVDVPVDFAFECTGGVDGCETALSHIIDCIRPQGVISLLGVAELPVPINTRMVLEKGLVLVGNSRSTVPDFAAALELMRQPTFAARVRRVVQKVLELDTTDDVAMISSIAEAFEYDSSHPFKTVMHWPA
ncbi:MAG: alcohol dehydrogenase catalytic domain-containing protein [Coriobacteriaceae bacterium]|nr:alcohol dehydrogenase catalytic domain-containing protein [Coriobacteriaceae bacterium]